MSRFWIGTSGYSYGEWRGPFYPPELSDEQMLSFYAAHFATVELNYTFYRTATVRTLQGWAKETHGDFRFSLKVPRAITHEMRLRDAAEALSYFCDTAKALKGHQGALLFQLPSFLKKDLSRLEDFLHQMPPGFRPAFEFRNASWFCDEVFDCLRRFDVALCIAEHDEQSSPFEVTAPFGYLRLRRSDYSDAELAVVAERLLLAGASWRDAFVYFKHEAGGKGALLAAKLRALLDPPAVTESVAAPA